MLNNKKILALDLGDVWVGIAIADQIGISCRPLITVQLTALFITLFSVIKDHAIATIIVGLPKTCSGTASEQTKKIIIQVKKIKKELDEKGFSTVQWKLWDERLSSKWAQQLQKKKPSPEEKKKEHARAAAFILQSYLDSLAFNNEHQEDVEQEL
jgi:putative Holliday junction resolvase